MVVHDGGKNGVDCLGGRAGKMESGHSDGKTTVTDLNVDTLAMCALKLPLRDLASMAEVCHQFREAAYADNIWEQHCLRQWPSQTTSWGGIFQFCGGRDAFVRRYYASQQFRYADPVDWTSHLALSPITHMLLGNESIAVSQGPAISIFRIGGPTEQLDLVHTQRVHGKITCMRLFPRELLPHSFRNNVMGPDNDVLVTSSTDRTIRLWGNGRNFKDTVAVNTLADRLLGRKGCGVLASGGEDGKVKLWSLSSAGVNRGRSPLLATFHAHSQAVKQLIVADHNDSLLVSASKCARSKIRVLDANTNTLAEGCVGMVNGPDGVPVKMECAGATCFVAGATRVVAVDLRTMSNVATIAVHEPGLATFARSSTGLVFGTGGYDKTAKLWDIRMCTDDQPEPWATLGDHVGPVHCLHVDRYKVVSGGQADRLVRVWDANTGDEISTLDTIELDPGCGVSAMCVRGSRLLTGTCGDVPGALRYRDFSNCTSPLEADETMSEPRSASKFWDADFDRDSKW